MVCWDRADGEARRATASLSGDKVTSWRICSREPNMTVDEWHEWMTCSATERVAKALARRGITDVAGADGHVGHGAALMPGRQTPQARLVRRSVPGSDVGSPHAFNVTGLHLVVRRHDDAARAGRPSTAWHSTPEVMGATPAEACSRRQCSRPAPLEDQRAGRGRLRPSTAISLLLAATALRWLGLETARAGAAPGRVPAAPIDGSARGGTGTLVRRDGGSYRLASRTPLPADRVPHRRVGPGLHDHVPSLGSDRLGDITDLGRGGADNYSRRASVTSNAICIHEEDSGVGPEARGGQAGRG